MANLRQRKLRDKEITITSGSKFVDVIVNNIDIAVGV